MFVDRITNFYIDDNSGRRNPSLFVALNKGSGTVSLTFTAFNVKPDEKRQIILTVSAIREGVISTTCLREVTLQSDYLERQHITLVDSRASVTHYLNFPVELLLANENYQATLTLVDEEGNSLDTAMAYFKAVEA